MKYRGMAGIVFSAVWLASTLGVAFGVFIWLTLVLLDLTYPAGGARWHHGMVWLAVTVPITYSTGIVFIYEVARIYQKFVC